MNMWNKDIPLTLKANNSNAYELLWALCIIFLCMYKWTIWMNTFKAETLI